MNLDAANTLKRCSSAPIINNPQTINRATATILARPMNTTTRSNNSGTNTTASRSRDASPTSNVFTPRARRYSTSFSPLAVTPGPCLTPRVSQLRQEECADINTRESNHEREVHNALQISQSWEDLTLDADNWSLKSEMDLSNSLHVNLPLGVSCSSPSPTSSRTNMRIVPYGLSPSPTRRTFQTRRSMSPIAMRPSTLSGVKRKFEMEESHTSSYSPPPFKRVFSDRGPSPCQSPLLTTCPSPDFTEGRTTPKFYISKLYSNNTNSSSSVSSSPSTAPSPCSSSTMEMQIDLPPSIINNISNSNSKNNSSEPNDLTSSSKDFTEIDLQNSNVESALAADGSDPNAYDGDSAGQKIKELFDGSETILLGHKIDEKMHKKKTEFFNVVIADGVNFAGTDNSKHTNVGVDEHDANRFVE